VEVEVEVVQALGGNGGSGIVIIRYYGLTVKASGGTISNANESSSS
jgi:hypothetical protein